MRLDASSLLCSRHLLTLAISAVLTTPAAAFEERGAVVADGIDHDAVYRSYITELDGIDGHAFHALNGGTISAVGGATLVTRGASAAGAHAASGGGIALHGGTVSTEGVSAFGLSVASGGWLHTRLDASGAGVAVSTTALGAHAVQAQQGRVELIGAMLTTRGDAAHGLHLDNGGIAQLDGGAIRTIGRNAYGLLVANGEANLSGTRVLTAGAGTQALMIRAGGRVDGDGLTLIAQGIGAGATTTQAGGALNLTTAWIETHGRVSSALHGAGDITARDSDIRVYGEQSRGVEMTGGTLRMEGGSIEALAADSSGVLIMSGVQAGFDGTRIEAEQYGLNINGQRNTVEANQITIDTRGVIGSGVWLPNASVLRLTDSGITTAGQQALGIDNRASAVVLRDVAVTTGGVSSHGLYASMDGRSGQPIFDADRVSVQSGGAGSIGAVVRLGGAITLRDSELVTRGARGYGVLTGGAGTLSLYNTNIRTHGADAWAAVVNGNGYLDMDGGTLVSQAHGALWVREARHLVLRNGAQVSGGNGVLMAVDAALNRPFDMALDSDARAQGDVVITAEDLAAGVPVRADIGVRLDRRSHWRGTTGVVNHLGMADESRWTMTGDARIGSLALDRSAVILSTAPDVGFHTLQVAGDLDSADGRFHFRGRLGDDLSPFDQLHIQGDTRGTAYVQVHNAGGLGDQTINGIRLVRVDGTSGASFQLIGRAVAGAYDYLLYQGGVSTPGDGHWYLRSERPAGPGPGTPCELDPAAPGCGDVSPPVEDCVDEGVCDGGEAGPGPGPGFLPCEVDPEAACTVRPPALLRPEVGAYLANQGAAVSLFQHRLHDRGAGPGTLGDAAAWMRVSSQNQQLGASDGLLLDRHASVLQAGVDVLRRGNVQHAHVGVMLGAGQARHEAVSPLTGYAAKGVVRGTALGLYGSWYQRPHSPAGAYVDVWAQQGRYRNSVEGTALARERYRSRTRAVSFEAGYGWALGRSDRQLLLQPQAQWIHTAHRSDGLVEQNGTRVQPGAAGGLSSRLGLRLSQAVHAADRVQPFLAVNWLRDPRGNSILLDDQPVRGAAPGHRKEVRAGALVSWGSHWSGWGELALQRGSQRYRGAAAQWGVRAHW